MAKSGKANTEKKKSKKGYREADKRFVSTKVVNGKKRFWYSRESKKDADRIRDEELAAEAKRPRNYRNCTLAEWLADWLKIVKGSEVRPKTYESYESNCRMHIIPAIGNYRLEEVTRPVVQTFLAECKQKKVCRRKNPTQEQLKACKPLGQRALQYIYVTLHAAMQAALEDEIITTNPCKPKDKPGYDLPQIVPLKEDEKRKLFAAIKEDVFLHAFITIALDTGLRSSELLNLKWANVDMKTGRFQVLQATEQVKGEGPKEGPTKSNTSKRAGKLTKHSLDLLTKYQLAQARQIKSYGIRYMDNDIIFAKPNGGLIPNYEISKQFKQAIKRAGIRNAARFHDTRHTLLTELAVMGIDAIRIKELAGHATLDMTMRYVHMGETWQDELVKKLEQKRSGSQEVVKQTTDFDNLSATNTANTSD